MKNDQLKPATAGEISRYKIFYGKNVAAVKGISDKGRGWRPVCGGVYVGSQVYKTEDLAIKAGQNIIKELAERVWAGNRKLPVVTAQAGDVQQTPPTVKPATKRARKKRNTQGAEK